MSELSEGYPDNESYAPSPLPDPSPEEPVAAPLSASQFRTILTPMISDPDDQTGARCSAPGPNVQAEGKAVNLPCIRRRGHADRGEPAHRSMQGEHPESRVFHEW